MSATAEGDDATEVAGFLADHSQVFLMTRRADGWPTVYPMVGRPSKDAGDSGTAVEFSTYRASAKVRNVRREQRASVLVVPRDPTADDRLLHGTGPVRMLDERESPEPSRQRPSGERSIEVPGEIVDKVARRHDSGKRIALRVEMERTWFSRREGEGGADAAR